MVWIVSLGCCIDLDWNITYFKATYHYYFCTPTFKTDLFVYQRVLA